MFTAFGFTICNLTSRQQASIGMASPALVRPSLTASSRIHVSAADVIKFLHPGYDAPNNILFALERVDPATAGSPNPFGVHHATALVGCQIIANNAWTGRLALDKDGEQPAEQQTSLDGVLTAKAYYFVVDGMRDEQRRFVVSSYPRVPELIVAHRSTDIPRRTLFPRLGLSTRRHTRVLAFDPRTRTRLGPLRPHRLFLLEDGRPPRAERGRRLVCEQLDGHVRHRQEDHGGLSEPGSLAGRHSHMAGQPRLGDHAQTNPRPGQSICRACPRYEARARILQYVPQHSAAPSRQNCTRIRLCTFCLDDDTAGETLRYLVHLAGRRARAKGKRKGATVVDRRNAGRPAQ